MDAKDDFIQPIENLAELKTNRQWPIGLLILASAIPLYLGLVSGCEAQLEKQTETDNSVALELPSDAEPLPAIVQTSAEREAVREQLDPRNGPWRGEVFAEEAGAQLSQLKALMTAGRLDGESLADLCVEGVTFGPLRPQDLATEFEREGLAVQSGLIGDGDRASGRIPLRDALHELLEPLGDPENRRIKFKIERVDLPDDETAETTVFYEASGDSLQQQAHWICQWQRGSGPPRLSGMRITNYREVAWREGGRWFVDDTAAVFGGQPAFDDQLAHGLNHWLRRIDRAYGLTYFGRTGLAIGDANGDGLDDLYLCQSGGLPNRLFLRQADGTALEAGARFGVDWLDHTSSALFLDLDNDGDQDLALAAGPRIAVLENVGNESFRRRASLRLLDRDTLSLSASDYDGDGHLDLFVCVGFATKSAHARAGRDLPGFVFHDSRDGGRNVLFRNETNWKFTDVTREAGLDEGNYRHSLAASWEDYDRDGDPDLYIANDYGPNALYRNEAGRFQEVAGELGVRDQAAGMSVSWGDYDRDGWMDLYIANMFSYAGHRISHEPAFLPDADPEFRALNERFAKGNSLFRNLGGSRFVETSAEAHVERARWAWGSVFTDLDNDGWEDLFVANGYITTEDTGDL